MAEPRDSMLDPKYLGGLIGGEGYAFQNAYVLYRLADWLIDPAFAGLQPSGHSHGGQVNLPFVGRPIPDLRRDDAGLYQPGRRPHRPAGALQLSARGGAADREA